MSDSDKIKEVFGKAHELPLDERAKFLDGVCATDPTLRTEIDSLLKAFDSADEFLVSRDGAAGEDSTVNAPVYKMDSQPKDAPLREGPGTVIGSYKLLQEIGHGGFGTVFLAEQRQPIVRKVALKVIKLGMDTRQVIARFQAERQALAMMDHPNIARVLDAGATDTGRPYFVMELVKGVSITKYCDENKLSPRDRLVLFADVCHAVQHAHQKGVIHRDLKPSNVLISRHDDKPVVKIIDFGIAKAIGGKLTEQTVFTEFQAILGTPAYMSPEQAGMSDLDIDTRSDIYSLGVLLYELLTGTTPFDERTLRHAGQDEIRRLIREVEPPKPSTRVSSLGSESCKRTSQDRSEQRECPNSRSSDITDIVLQRGVDLRSLKRLLLGDLDWIVMKCLEKDRTRRYETANALAMDVGRYLNDEPVLADPPTATYRLHKYIRRHRWGVVAGTAISAALILGAIIAAWGMVRATTARAVAERQRQRAETITEFLTKALHPSDPLLGGVKEMLVTDALVEAIQGIDAQAFAGDAETKAGLQSIFGTILLNNGKVAEALPLLQDALSTYDRILEINHPKLPRCLINLGFAKLEMGQTSEAGALFERAMSMSQLIFRGDHVDIADSLTGVAAVLRGQGRAADAEPLYSRALEMRERMFKGDDAEVALSLNSLGVARLALGRPADAEPLFRQAMDMYMRLYPGDHPGTALTQSNLGLALQDLDRPAEAESLHRQALATRRRLFKGDHPDVARESSNLARCLLALGKIDEAAIQATEAVGMYERLFNNDHPRKAVAMSTLALVLYRQGKPRDAEDLMGRAEKMVLATGPVTGPDAQRVLRAKEEIHHP